MVGGSAPYLGYAILEAEQMNMAKSYTAIDGSELTIHQMVREEPDWAATRVQVGEEAIKVLDAIKEWDIANYKKHGYFFLPQRLREQLQRVSA